MAGRVWIAGSVLIAALAGGTAMGLWPVRDGPRAYGQATASPLPTLAPTPTSGPGRYLYLRDCAWCHGAQGQGSTNGPSLIGVGASSADFMLSTGRMPIPRVEVQPRRQASPYSPAQTRALVEFVAAMGPGPAIPSVDPARGSPAEGEELYQANCAACHGAPGAGGALTNGLFAPNLRDSTPVQVAEAIRLGGAGLRSGNMPRFGPETFTDQQADSIVRYVEYLRRPEDRGGQSLGHLGPIPEGFVAWAVGLLALLLAARWIGTKE